MKINFKIRCFVFFLAICNLQFCAENNQKNNLQYFRYNQSSGINTLDPAFAKDQAIIWATQQLFDGLVQVDKNLNVKPAIAKSWKISEDGLTYTFQLREDVYFHPNPYFESRKVNAQDFVYSFNRIIDKKVASTGAWIFNNKVIDNQPFKATDKFTFQIKLKKPFPAMLGILTMPYCFVVPKEIANDKLKFRSNPVGTGAFKLKLWKENEVMIFEKNEFYFEKGFPKLDGVRITFNENKKTEFLKFKEKKLDFISGIDASYLNDVLDKEGNLKSELQNNFTLQKSPYLNTEYLGFNLETGKNEALKNKKVRQAINYAFDRKKMMQYIRNNIGTSANSGFIPKGLPSYKAETGYHYNLKKARILLKEAGYPFGKGIEPFKLYTNANYQDLCTYIIKELNAIGIPAEMEITQSSFLREMMVKGNADFFRGSWIADYPDAENYLAVFYGKNPAPPNYTRFNNAYFNNLYQQALTQSNLESRNTLYQKMDKIIIDEAPIVPLYYDMVLRFVQNNITGLENNGQNLLILKTVEKN